MPVTETLLALGLFDTVLTWLSYLWWAWLILIAWWIYGWVQEKLGFAPIAALAISAVLIYFLVIEYPLVGSIGYIGYVIIFGGIMYILPYFLGPAFWFVGRRHR
jgi:hypothetical protein